MHDDVLSVSLKMVMMMKMIEVLHVLSAAAPLLSAEPRVFSRRDFEFLEACLQKIEQHWCRTQRVCSTTDAVAAAVAFFGDAAGVLSLRTSVA